MIGIFSKKNKMSYARIMALGFLGVIFAGAALLMLPVSSRAGEWSTPLLAIFTATSATCVTGLVMVDTYQYFTLFGQVVILVMIQIGGLGFITLGVMFSMFLKKRINLKKRSLIQESMNAMQLSGIVRLVKHILKGTFLLEGIGAVLLSARFIPQMGVWEGIYNGIFHSVTAFCNAGFDLMGKYAAYSSLTGYQDDIIVNITIMVLIILGGIGFIVWEEVKDKGIHIRRYTLHTKIVLISTAVLIVIPAMLFLLLENGNLLAGKPELEKILSAFFASVTARTAGFNTIDVGKMTQASKILTVVLMFIGGCPGSTAGGVKTTTIVVMLVYIWSNLRNSSGSNIGGRRLADEDIKKASMVFGLNLGLSVIAVLLISCMQYFSMEDLLLEVFSAIGTVGLSTGITRQLQPLSLCVIIFLMYCGRIGSMTFALSFTYRHEKTQVLLPEEHVNIG